MAALVYRSNLPSTPVLVVRKPGRFRRFKISMGFQCPVDACHHVVERLRCHAYRPDYRSKHTDGDINAIQSPKMIRWPVPWLLRTFCYSLPQMAQLRENRSPAERVCERLKQGWRGLPRPVNTQNPGDDVLLDWVPTRRPRGEVPEWGLNHSNTRGA